MWNECIPHPLTSLRGKCFSTLYLSVKKWDVFCEFDPPVPSHLASSVDFLTLEGGDDRWAIVDPDESGFRLLGTAWVQASNMELVPEFFNEAVIYCAKGYLQYKRWPEEDYIRQIIDVYTDPDCHFTIDIYAEGVARAWRLCEGDEDEAKVCSHFAGRGLILGGYSRFNCPAVFKESDEATNNDGSKNEDNEGLGNEQRFEEGDGDGDQQEQAQYEEDEEEGYDDDQQDQAQDEEHEEEAEEEDYQDEEDEEEEKNDKAEERDGEEEEDDDEEKDEEYIQVSEEQKITEFQDHLNEGDENVPAVLRKRVSRPPNQKSIQKPAVVDALHGIQEMNIDPPDRLSRHASGFVLQAFLRAPPV